MVFRFRKSFNLGKHFRINLSKNGIGYSVGAKGVRLSHGADGKDRLTTSVPGTGLSSTHTLRSSRKKSSGCLTVLLVPAALVILILLILMVTGMFDEDKIPPPPENPVIAETPEEGLRFADDGTVLLQIGESASLSVELPGEGITADDLVMEGGDPSLAEISADGTVYHIKALAPGLLNLSVRTADGTQCTSVTQVIIEDPAEDTPVTYYVVNTANRKIHLGGCSYAPEAGSENRDVVTDISGLTADGYTWCEYCQ